MREKQLPLFMETDLTGPDFTESDLAGEAVTRQRIAGVDEVGRGPLAGPVVAAAVILHPERSIEGLKDSKKLSHRQRLGLAEQIKQQSVAWATGWSSVEEIDELNILQASLLAMQRAVSRLSPAATQVKVDGNKLPKLNIPAEAIVQGDAKVAAISAASILAKVERDTEMERLDRIYPGYGFAGHKGYPTRQHLAALETHGVTDIHRRSYAPVKQCLSANKG